MILTVTSQAQEIVWDTTFVVDKNEFKVIACRSDKESFAQLIKSNKDV